MSAESASVYCFGVFEFDSHTAELRKGGIKLKLQEQQRQVLVRLVKHPGEIVSREELRSLLWSENTFVDFETGLNTAVKRLRDTLGDSAENPRFIETIPRKGYKFIAPIEVVAKANGSKRTTARQVCWHERAMGDPQSAGRRCYRTIDHWGDCGRASERRNC